MSSKQDRSAASSSSFSHSIPASITQSWNYDVFMSFRGEDTRKRFVDHLYKALVQQGILTCKDEGTLDLGEPGPALLKAIQDSRIAVIVFSENYADSSWCLDELAHIMECMDTRGQIVMPIFYQVDPSDVRTLKKYGEAFDKHAGENKFKVESWRKALEKAGTLSGWIINGFENSHEAKCIKEIVGTIFSRLSSLFTNVNKDLIGIETRLQDLKSKLKIESGGVRIIGIWGVGGGGKTTLASAAYAEISHRFEAHCLLQNIREESRKHGLEKLQEKFLSLILKADVKVGSEMEGRIMIERRLRNKSVLVVIDNVDDLKQLEALAGSHAWFGEGSRIIITTRDEHLLTRHADKIYEVSLLSQDEAMELFNKHAYRKDKPIEDYEMLSKDLVSYASGLPLVLEILGSFLYDKNKNEWKSALAKLKCIPNVEVTEILKISYDGLEPDHQKLFLDIACFWRRRNMDEAMMVLDACNLHPRIGVKVLVQKSLIKVDSDGEFEMHDLVEEMAHYIVRGEHPKSLEKHSRISQSWNYDVFMSFRGEDTRKSFVDHLYTALAQQGIHTYKDGETLARGESIDPAHLKPIQESQIAVIVFSENYADSSWCLDELAHIMDCMDTRGQIVMPIFYQVDPSDVRKLKRKYGEAFDKHAGENKFKVESWRKALEKVGKLSGWVINDFENSHEAKCIKEIVGTICSRLSSLITNVNKDLIGIERRLQDLKSKLKIESGGVRIIGIWGVGGGGKTTLASAAYAEISHRFEAHCLLQHIREETKQHGLKKLQENLLSLVLKTKDIVVGSEIEGRSMIGRRLRNKSVLVVLDDVDDLTQLEALAGSHAWFGEGSRIIITTRDEQLLTRHADEAYEVSLLSRDEAIKLFSRYAFQKNNPIDDYKMLSKDVVSYAVGLPLVIKVLGSFLYDKDKDEWNSALAKLKCIPEDKVLERLKISYDGLTTDEKVLFLDIACCFRGEDKDYAMMVLDACDLHPGIGIKVLVQKSLIKVSNGRFEMHDLIEEMAHNIVRGEHPNHPEKHSRIWKMEDIAYLCDMGAAAPSMETEVLALRTTTSQHPGLSLSDVVANMKKLRWIHLYNYPASSFSSNFEPRELGCLELTWSKQKELWHGYKSLPNLKILDLRNSENLIKTPNFEGLPCLERLILKECESLEEIHPSIGYHKRLVFVDMSYCVRLKRFPPIIQMEKLETLILSKCRELQQFPDIQSNMSLPNLKILHLFGLKNLIRTPDFKGLPCLEELHLSRCESLEEIHPSIGYHKRLVFVDMSWCTALKRFPLIIHMKKLKTLNLWGCKQLQQFPDIQSDMDSLVTLYLGLTKIEIIPPSVERFCTNLVSLDLGGCSKLKKIEGNFHLLRSLKDLDLYGCKGLQSFHQDRSVSLKLPQFPRFLRKLNLSGCNLGDGNIPSDICELLNLQVLDLSYNNFSRLPSVVSQIPYLKLLNLSHCVNLVELPELPSSIAILYAYRCGSLEIVRDLSEYKWLWKVSLWGRTNCRALYSMLEGNAVKDRVMSVVSRRKVEPSSIYTEFVRLQLPHNWYNDFNGFLLSLHVSEYYNKTYNIVIRREMSTDHSKKFDKDCREPYKYERVGYVPFSSLRHIPWFNPTYTQNISFKADYGGLNVELVRSKGKISDSNEHQIDYSECWDEEYEDTKTFEIIHDANSSEIQIVWFH